LRKAAPSRAANTTLVSRNADTAPIALASIAQIMAAIGGERDQPTAGRLARFRQRHHEYLPLAPARYQRRDGKEEREQPAGISDPVTGSAYAEAIDHM